MNYYRTTVLSSESALPQATKRPPTRERCSRGLAKGENSRILRLESKLSDLRMENANQLTCKASDRSEVGAFLHQNKKPTTRVGFLISAKHRSWRFAKSKYSHACRLQASLTRLHGECEPAHLRGQVTSPKLEHSFTKTKNRPQGSVYGLVQI